MGSTVELTLSTGLQVNQFWEHEYERSGFVSSLYNLDINPVSDGQLARILSYSPDFPFFQLVVSLVVKKLLSFMRIYLNL